MPYTESDLAAIQQARLRGVRTVQFGDRSTTYTSDSEMRQVETDIRAELARTTGRQRQFFVSTGKGLSS